MKTQIQKAIDEFERLQSKAETLKDRIYLDGVLAVLDGFKNEKTHVYLKDIKKDTRFLCEIVNKSSKTLPREIKEFTCIEMTESRIKVKENCFGTIHWFTKEMFDNTSGFGISGFFIVEILK